MNPLEVQEYITRDGFIPFRNWLFNLNNKIDTARILSRVARIKSGNFGDAKPVGHGIFELRLFFGPGYRIYFGRVAQTVVLLLLGGDKSSQ